MEKLLIIAFALGFFTPISSDSQELNLPFRDDGACPFECCQYSNWLVTKTTRLLSSPDGTAASVETLRRGETVAALTGFVLTEKAGSVEIVNPITRRLNFTDSKSSSSPDEREFNPPQVISSLHYLGEGSCLYWLEGRTVAIDLYCLKEGILPIPQDYKVLSEPKTSWWVKFRTAKGTIGWSDKVANFRNQDACG